MMSYCVMNTQKRRACDVSGLQAEANRELEPDEYKNQIDPARTPDNIYLIRSDDWHASIAEVLQGAGVEANKNSVVLLTSVYTASPDWFQSHTPDEIRSYFETCLEFEKANRGEVINAVIHMDETTPHMQVATVPVVDVPTKTCEQVGVYTTGKSKGKPKYRRTVATDEAGNVITHKGLNAGYVIGNKVKMSKTQTAFWETCGKPYGMERGECRVEETAEARERLSEVEYQIKAREDAVSRRESQARAADKAIQDLLDSIETRIVALDEREVGLDDKETDLDLREHNIDIEVKNRLEERVRGREVRLKSREKTLAAEESRLKAERADFDRERETFTRERKTWQETADRRLEGAKKGYEDAKAGYERARTSYELAADKAEGVARGFSLDTIDKYSKALRVELQRRCESIRYNSGRTLWDVAGRVILQVLQDSVQTTTERTAPAVLQTQRARTTRADRELPEMPTRYTSSSDYGLEY